jgi:hypothetical protein
MQFGVYLVENDVISSDEFFEAIKLQLRTRPQLGALAIELHKLNARQVFALLRQQSDSPEDLFGELALRAGYLTAKDLSELVDEQLRRVTPLHELLVDMGILSAEAVERHYCEFRRTMERADERELATTLGS